MVTLLTPTLNEWFRQLNIVKIAPGKYHGVGLTEAGVLYSWGAPMHGALARKQTSSFTDSLDPYPIPRPVEGLGCGRVVDVASGNVSAFFSIAYVVVVCFRVHRR